MDAASCLSLRWPDWANAAAMACHAPRASARLVAAAVAALHSVRLQQPTVLGSLHSPQIGVVPLLAAGGLARRFGLDAVAAQLLGEGLAPKVQVGSDACRVVIRRAR